MYPLLPKLLKLCLVEMFYHTHQVNLSYRASYLYDKKSRFNPKPTQTSYEKEVLEFPVIMNPNLHQFSVLILHHINYI